MRILSKKRKKLGVKFESSEDGISEYLDEGWII